MRKFDTKIQYLKYKVLREVARYGFEDNLDAAYYEIPKLIVKEKPTMRCCIYKERAIVEERIKLAMGGDKKNPNVIEVIEIACDECPVSGHVVTESCRGCLAHRCEDVCRRGAITFDEQQKAHIDKSKCVECGQCAKVCPYSAIRAHCLAQVDTLWEEVTRFENPHSYYVDLSQKLWDEKNRLLSENQY